MNMKGKIDLYAKIRHEYRWGVATIRGLAQMFKVHRRLVRDALDNPLPPQRKIPLNALQLLNGFELALVSFFLCERTSCAKLRSMISIYSGRNKRAHISIAVYLRLTSMDVCCGPPAFS